MHESTRYDGIFKSTRLHWTADNVLWQKGMNGLSASIMHNNGVASVVYRGLLIEFALTALTEPIAFGHRAYIVAAYCCSRKREYAISVNQESFHCRRSVYVRLWTGMLQSKQVKVNSIEKLAAAE